MPAQTDVALITRLILTGYLVIGALLEERKMRALLGDPYLEYCRHFQRRIQRGKTLKMTPKRYTKTVYLRMSDRNGERSQLRRQ